MAINFAALLGGFGSGYQQAQQQRRQNRREDLAELRADQAQSNTIFNQIQELVRTDAADEAKTLQDLRTAGLDPGMRQALMDQRRKRHESAQQTIGSLSGQPGIIKQYGNVKNMLAPSMLMGGGFEVKPYMSEEGLRSIAAMGTKEAREADQREKAGVIERYRKDLLQYAPQDYVDRILPQIGANLGYAAPTAAKPLQATTDIGKLAKDIPGFIPGVGGERILPTGAKQRIYYKDGKPMVDYAKGMTADYTPPEATRLKNQKMGEELRQLRGMYDYKQQLAKANIENKQWQTSLLQEKVKTYAPEARARMQKYLSNTSAKNAETNAKLRLLSILLSAEQRQQGLNLDERQFGFDVAYKRQQLLNGIDSDLQAMQKELRDARAGAGKYRDLGFKGAWDGTMGGIQELESQIAGLASQRNALASGNVGMAGQVLGGFGDVNAINPMALLGQSQGRGDMLQQMAMMNMLRGPQQAPQPQVIPMPIPMGGQQQSIDPNALLGVIGRAMGMGGTMGGGNPLAGGAAGGPGAGAGQGQPGTFVPGYLRMGQRSPEDYQKRLAFLQKLFPKAAAKPEMRDQFEFFAMLPRDLNAVERANLINQNR